MQLKFIKLESNAIKTYNAYKKINNAVKLDNKNIK